MCNSIENKNVYSEDSLSVLSQTSPHGSSLYQELVS